MSTYINVTVGKAGLSDQAKQQTNANRQAKLEADARNKAEVDGKRQRDANRALQGIGPDGKPLFGQPLQTAVRKDEPAAWRITQGYAVTGVKISNILASKNGNEQIRTVTLSTVGESFTQTYDLYEFPLADGYDISATTYNSGRTAFSHNVAITSTYPQYANKPITDSLFAAAASAGLPSIKTIDINRRSLEKAEDYLVAHFPLSGDSIVLTIVGRFSGLATMRNETIVETIHEQTVPTLDPNPLSEAAAVYFRNHSTSLQSSNSTGAPVSGSYSKSWLVTSAEITEIATPNELAAKLLALVPEYNYSTTSNQETYTIYNRTYTDAGLYYDFDQPFETLPFQSPQPVRIREEDRLYGVTYWPYASPSTGNGLYVFCDYSAPVQTVTYYTPNRTTAAEGSPFYNSSQYGIWGYASPDACYSPGVYALLDNSDISYEYEKNEDVAFLKSTYMAAFPDPAVALQAVVKIDENDVTFKRFDIRKPMSNTLVAEESLKLNKSKKALFNQYDGYDFVWDWGKPAFCRTKLLALGFTEADLKP
jgi:hypothetical protein